METPIKPIHDRVLIKRLEAPKREDGLIITDAVEEKPSVGTVIATGPGKYTDRGFLVPVTVEPGQTVTFRRGQGTVVKVRGEEFLMIYEEDILGVLQ